MGTNNSSALDLNVGSGNCSVECQQTGYNYVYVTSSNLCGTSLFRQIPINVTSGGGGGGPIGPMLSVNPNPANTLITIELQEDNTKTNTVQEGGRRKEKLEVTIYNDKNIPVYSKLTENKKLQVNTQNFPNGLYYLRIKSGEQVYSRQLVVKH